MKEFNVLKKRIEEVVLLVNSLKQERRKLLERIEKQKADIEFMEGENREAKKMGGQAERLGKERKEIRDRLQNLLDRLEKMNV